MGKIYIEEKIKFRSHLQKFSTKLHSKSSLWQRSIFIKCRYVSCLTLVSCRRGGNLSYKT